MGTLSYFPDPRPQLRSASVAGLPGQVVGMRHVDLETVIETVELLRSLENQSFLDRYNRRANTRVRSSPEGPICQVQHCESRIRALNIDADS
jgi:hypothetical protein